MQSPSQKYKKRTREIRVKDKGVIYRRAMLDLNRITEEIEKECANEVKGHYIRMKKTRIFRAINDLIECLRQCEPQCVCPSCNGDGCPKCHDTGFHTKAGGDHGG